MNIAVFFKLIRYKNLLLIIYTLTLINFVFFKAFNISENLSNFQFLLLLMAIVAITAAGYIINDIFDVVADEVNKPSKVIVGKKISVEKAQKLYFFINSFGIITGVIFSLNLKKPEVSFYFFTIALLLYFYSKKLKSVVLLGNFIVSCVIAVNFIFYGCIAVNTTVLNEYNSLVINTLIALAIFAFLLNFAREILKDIEDIKGDKKLNMNTLPILIGRKRALFITAVFCTVSLLFLVWIMLNFSEDFKFTMLYLLIMVFLPLLYVAIQFFKISSLKKIHSLSTFLKIIMFLGISGLLIFSLKI